MTSTNVDDQDPSIIYAGGAWTRHTNQEASFELYGNSDTFSDVQGATATFTFEGTGIEYWGNQGRYHGPCTVRLDGNVVATANSNNPADAAPPILLYSATNLAQGRHTIVITVAAAAYPNVCEVDRFVVYQAATSSTTDNPGTVTVPTTVTTTATTSRYTTGTNTLNGTITDDNNTTNNSSKSKVPVGAIAGAIGGVVGLLALIGLYCLFAKRSKKKKSQNYGNQPASTVPESKPLVKPPPGADDIEKAATYGAAAYGLHHQQQADPRPTSYASTASPTMVSHPSYQAVPPTPSSGTHLLAPYPPPTPNSTINRPNSALSSSSGAATSYYPSGAPIPEDAAYAYYNQPYSPGPQQYPQQHYQQQQFQQQFQQGYQPPSSPPVWATSEASQYTASPPMSPQPIAPLHVPAVVPAIVPATSPSPSSTPYPVEKASYTGPFSPPISTQGASGSSSAPPVSLPTQEKPPLTPEPVAISTAGPRITQDSENLLGAGVTSPTGGAPDLPPPAYTDAWQGTPR